MNTAALIEEAVSLPVEERTLVVESLLQSLNRPVSEIDQEWKRVAQKRLAAIQNGEVQVVDGEKVFNNIWHSFEK